MQNVKIILTTICFLCKKTFAWGTEAREEATEEREEEAEAEEEGWKANKRKNAEKATK